MGEYSPANIENHPSVSSKYVRFLTHNSGLQKVAPLEAAMTALEKENKALKTELAIVAKASKAATATASQAMNKAETAKSTADKALTAARSKKLLDGPNGSSAGEIPHSQPVSARRIVEQSGLWRRGSDMTRPAFIVSKPGWDWALALGCSGWRNLHVSSPALHSALHTAVETFLRTRTDSFLFEGVGAKPNMAATTSPLFLSGTVPFVAEALASYGYLFPTILAFLLPGGSWQQPKPPDLDWSILKHSWAGNVTTFSGWLGI